MTTSSLDDNSVDEDEESGVRSDRLVLAEVRLVRAVVLEHVPAVRARPGEEIRDDRAASRIRGRHGDEAIVDLEAEVDRVVPRPTPRVREAATAARRLTRRKLRIEALLDVGALEG